MIITLTRASNPIGRQTFILHIRQNYKQPQHFRLTESEGMLIDTLLTAAPHGCTTGTLMKKIGYQPGTKSHAVAAHIYRIRQKVGSSDFITFRDGSYRLKHT